MHRQVKQLIILSMFALGLHGDRHGAELRWCPGPGRDAGDGGRQGSEGLPPIAEVAEKLNPTVVSILNTSFVRPVPGRKRFSVWRRLLQLVLRPAAAQPRRPRMMSSGSWPAAPAC